jgi:hypothetical protein
MRFAVPELSGLWLTLAGGLVGVFCRLVACPLPRRVLIHLSFFPVALRGDDLSFAEINCISANPPAFLESEGRWQAWQKARAKEKERVALDKKLKRPAVCPAMIT